MADYEWRVEHKPDEGVSNFSVFDVRKPLGSGSYSRMYRNILHAEVQTDAGGAGNEHRVNYLGGDYEGRAHLGTMLGLIHQHAQKSGKSITIDPSDVSQHSVKLVNNLADRGIIPEESRPKKRAKLNKETFVGDRWEHARSIGQKVSDDEASAARRHTFELLRSNPRKPKGK
jgi:hypothetical protein